MVKKILSLCMFLSLAANAAGAGFSLYTNAQIKAINCSNQKMKLFYYYLDPKQDANVNNSSIDCGNGKQSVKKPQWLDKAVPEMAGRMVWRDPVEGVLSEAALWQTPVAILYELSDLTIKTFPPSDKGIGMMPGLLVKEYADIKVRYNMSLDRIYRARLSDSLDGRGRSVIPTLELINKEMDSISESIATNNNKRFAAAVTSIAVLSQDAFGQLFERPRQSAVSETKTNAVDLFWMLVKVGTALMLFFYVLFLLGKNEEGTNRLIANFMSRTKGWKEAFDRQFLSSIKVEYLVLVPIGLFAFAGIMTMNLFGFIILTGAGVFIGTKMPGMVLNFMKERRGKLIDAQLMDALILLSNSLKSGMDIVQGFEMVSKDLQPPIADEFGLVVKNYQLGTSFEKALDGLCERVTSRLLLYMVKSIVLQRQVGGNLTKIFERIVDNIREESKLEEKTKALTAQQKIQSIVVGIMPWIMLAVMFAFQGQTMAKFYFRPIGLVVLLGCAVWIGIGMKMVSDMGKIRV